MSYYILYYIILCIVIYYIVISNVGDNRRVMICERTTCRPCGDKLKILNEYFFFIKNVRYMTLMHIR